MASRTAVMAATLLLLVACTGAPPATPSPQPTPTLAPPFTPAPPLSPTAAPTPTLSPTAAPTTAPTEAPTIAPTPTAEPTPTAGGETFVELFADDMSDPTSGWGTGQTAAGAVSYADETLDLTPSQAGAYLWSRRSVDTSWPAMRVSGTLLPAPESSGYLGFLCGQADNDLLGAVVSTGGGWVFARIRDGAAQVLGSDLDAGLEVGLAEPIAYMLDCVVQPDGTLSMELYVNGQSIGSQSADDGPPGLDRVAAYAETDQGSFTARFDDVRLIASSDPGGLPEPMSNAALDLLQHVPEVYRALCFETAVSGAEPGALAAITCGLPEDNAVDLAEYVQFDSPETMNAAYQQRVATYGDGGDGGCDQGPAEGPYTISGEDAGRLLCAEQIVGARYDWTDNRLDILSNLTDFDADYGALYEVWLEAGPDL